MLATLPPSPQYFAEVHGAIFVVDAADKARFDEAREALHTALEDKRLAGKPVLVFANKQDVGGAATTAELATALELNSVGDVPIHVQACVAQTPEDATVDASIGDGRKWLVANVQSNLKTLSKRVAEQSAEQRAFEKAEKEKRFARAQAAKAQRLKEEAEEEARAEAKAKQAEEGIVEPASDVPQVNGAPSGPPADAQAAPVAGAAPASMPTDGPRAPATVSEPLPAVTPVKASISGNQVGPASIYAPHSAAGSTLPPVSSSPTPGASSLPPIRNSPDAGGAVALPNAIPSPVPPPPLKGADATERV